MAHGGWSLVAWLAAGLVAACSSGSGSGGIGGAAGVGAAAGFGGDVDGGGATGGGGTAATGGAAGIGGAAGGSGTAQTLTTAQGTLTLTRDDGSSPPCDSTLDIDATEDGSEPWLCPSCTSWFRGQSTVSSSTCPGATSYSAGFGWSSEGTFYYAAGESLARAFGSATEQGGTVSIIVNASFDLGTVTVTFGGSGTLALGSTEGDLLHGWRPASAYSCGWPKADPPAFAGSHEPQVGDPLPDGVFMDQCGDKVRLYDLLGSFLVIQASALADCSVCQLAAQSQKQFEDDMKSIGIPTIVVSMQLSGLASSEPGPTAAELGAWATQYGTTGVVLADRGYANAIIGSAANAKWSFGYPAYLLVAPDGTILFSRIGLVNAPSAAATWDDLKNRIQTAASP